MTICVTVNCSLINSFGDAKRDVDIDYVFDYYNYSSRLYISLVSCTIETHFDISNHSI